MSFYKSAFWRRLARAAKVRDRFQCQICGDRPGDPHCILHAHHITPHVKGGKDALENLITICDLCHAVVTGWWHRMWFRQASREELEGCRQTYEEFLRSPSAERAAWQRRVWAEFGIRPA